MTEEMYDSDEDLESNEEIEAPASSAPEVDVKKLRREAQGLRKRLREAEMEVLKTRFGEDVVQLIPEEVTDHQRRVELAEKFASIVKPSSGEAVQADQATDEGSQDEPDSAEAEAIAAVAKGPGSSSPGVGMDQDELLKIATTDPEAYLRLKASGHALERLPGHNP